MRTIKLTKEFHKKFTDALRSGDYEQVDGQLYNVTEMDGTIQHCCLGVAFEMCSKDEPEEWINISLPSDVDDDWIEKINYPQSLIDNENILAELNDGFVTDSILENRAKYWNMIYDNNTLISQYSFSQIAEFIDNNLEIIK